MRNLNSHHGIGLLELMLSIIVITAIILGATKYYLVAREAMRITQAEDMVNNVAKAAYTWVEGHDNFNDLDGKSGKGLKSLVDANLIPATYMDGHCNPWGGTMYSWNIREDFGGGRWLNINLEAVPGNSCVMLMNKFGGLCSKIPDWSGVTSCGETSGSTCRIFFREP